VIYESVHSDRSDYRGVWFCNILVHVRNVPLAQHQAGRRRIRHGKRIIQSAAKNEQMEFLGRRIDGRNRLAVSVG
jgi:hypothetical protein